MKVHRKTRPSLERGEALGKVLMAVVALGVIGGGYAAVRHLINEKQSRQDSAHHWVAQRLPFTVTAKLTGTLKSTDAVELKSELEGHSTIQAVIPDGSEVKGNFEYMVKEGDTLASIAEEYEKDELNIKRLNEDYEVDWENLPAGQQIVLPGDLLVELDPLDLKRKINQMEITVQRSENALARQQGNLKTTILSAEFQLKVVENTYQLAIQAKEETIKSTIKTKIAEEQGTITNQLNEVAVAEDKLKWLRELESRNFVSKMSLREEENKLSRLQHNIKMNQEKLDAYLTYRQPALLSVAELQIDEAKVNIEKTKVSNAADIADANATIMTQLKTLKLEREGLEELREQMANTRIYAPVPGTVQYHTPREWERREPVNNGAHVSRGHKLVKVARDKKLKVDLSVPQAKRPQLKRGMKAWVQVDTGSGSSTPLPGTLSYISSTVDSNRRGHTGKSNFEGVVSFDEGVDMPDAASEGMTVTIEILIIDLKGKNERIKVPNQCVTSRILEDDKTETGCYVFNASERTYNWRPVTIEYSDENFIAIKDEFDANAPADKKRGLQEGEEIHLSPLTQAESLKDDEVQNNRKNGESNGKPDAKKGDTLNLEEGVTNKGATELDKADPQEKPQLVGQPRDFGLTIEQRRKWLTAMDEVKAKINSVTDDVHSGRLSPTRMATLYSEALDAHRLSVKAFLTGEQMKKYDKWMDPQRKELKAAKLKTGPTKKPGTGAKDATETNNSEPDTTKTETAKPQTTKPSTTEDSTASATDNAKAKAKDEPADFALTDEQRKQWTTSRSVFEEAKKNATNELAAGKLTSTTLRDRFKAIFEADRESVQKFLTPDQLAKYDEWIKPQKSIFGL